jgi:D-aminoacyl-tRNA deacylase
MRCVVQRVSAARVRINDRTVGDIGRGLLALVGVARDDGPADLLYTAGKLLDMRVFEGEAGRPMDRSVRDVGGAILVVSQFTVCGDLRRGRRPAFDLAAPPEQARALYEALVSHLRATGIQVETGEFQAMMQVDLVNDGPVTVLLDSRRTF